MKIVSNIKNMRNITLVALGCLLVLTSCKNAAFFAKKGNESFVNGNYQSAISNYEQAMIKGDTTADINYKIAESYRMSNRLQQAYPYYKTAIDLGVKKMGAPLYYGLSLKSVGQYGEAVKVLNAFAKKAPTRNYKKRALYESKKIAKIDKLPFIKWKFQIENANQLNSEAEDYAPVQLGDELIFASSRGEGAVYEGTGYGFSNLYKADQSGSVSKLDESGKINTVNRHEASATFSPDGKTMVFARSNSGNKKEKIQDVDLYMSTMSDDGQWGEPTKLTINEAYSWEGCPLFSRDGKYLYFVSDRKGGRGGLDLWKATYKNGEFARPKNMGKTYNTFGDEMFPFIHENGSFYFSSDGHVGYGGLDLFKRVSENGKLVGKPINLGKSINSISDDFGIFYTDKNSGYVCSNREGGQGGDDIYNFTEEVIPFYYLDLEVKEGMAGLNHAGVTFLEDGKEVESNFSDELGHYRHQLHQGGIYELKVAKDSFFTASLTFTLDMAEIAKNDKNEDGDYVIKELINLKKVGAQESYDVKELGYDIKDILFDVGTETIRTDAAVELDKLIGFLQDNPGISIELGSHTDSRDSDANNLALSTKRAESTVSYITTKGNIISDRISAKGYGESMLLNKCRNGVTCSEEEHQKNRRTEIKILGVKNVNGEKYEEFKRAQEEARMRAEEEARHEQMEEEFLMIEDLKKEIAELEKSKVTEESDPAGYKKYVEKKERLAKIEKHFHELEGEEEQFKKEHEKQNEDDHQKYLDMKKKLEEMEKKMKELEKKNKK